MNPLRIAAALGFVVIAGLGARVADGVEHRSPIALAAANVCGGENRWDVKTLSDLAGPGAPKLKQNAEKRTIHYLVAQDHDPIGKHTPRLAGVERTKYVLTGVTLIEAKVEDDQDVHLAIRDAHRDASDHMIVEFPNVACNVNAPTVYKNQMAKARAGIEGLLPQCRSGFKNGWAQFRQGTTATIRGVGFFDLVHGSNLHGVAENEVELHPVLAFQGSC